MNKNKEEKKYITLKDTFKILEEQANELIDFGNSKEKEKGKGIKETLETIYDYCYKNKIILWK
jgi:hypothetical protein